MTSPLAWKDADLKAMPPAKATAKNKDGSTTDYTGVSLKSLVDLAKLAGDAVTLVFIGSDGYQAEAALKDVLACDQCIVGFNPAGGYILVMPGFPNKLSVKGLVEIQAK